MLRKKLTLILCMVFIAGSSLTAQDYIGSAKCKMCHNKSTTGAQYKVWAAGPHAKSWDALNSEKGKAYADKHGIADPAKDPKCISCHTTYGSIDQNLNASLKLQEGVSCESCHGPGSMYKSASVMKDQAKSIAKGLIVPDEKLCAKCHTDNKYHDQKPFVYAEALKQIAHPNPAAK